MALPTWVLLSFAFIWLTPVFETVDPAQDPVMVRGALSVVNVLVNVLTTDEESAKDLTAAEETVRGLTFDKFNEKVSCKVMKGIELRDFDTVIERIAKRLQIPDDIKESILDGKYAEENYEIVLDFKFSKGEDGGFTYGRIATIKRPGNVIDAAYSVYNLVFKLSPKVVEHVKKQKFLGFTLREQKWKENIDRNLSEREQDHMRAYFLRKAIDGFRKEYAGLIKADTCPAGAGPDCH